jgi:hypothetical protein
VIVAIPGTTPVTAPVVDTVAIAGSLVDQVTVQPFWGTGPLVERFAARSFCPPASTHAFGWDEMVTELTTDAVPPDAVDTAIVASAVLVPDAAEIVVDPGATPVTTPAASTVAMAGAVVDQMIGQPPAGAVPTVVRSGVNEPCAPGAR